MSPCDFCGDVAPVATIFRCPPFTMRLVRTGTGSLMIYSPEAAAGPSTAYHGDGREVDGLFNPADAAELPELARCGYLADWSSCARCAPLVAAQRWDELLETVPPGPLRVASRGIWQLFWSMSTGETVSPH